MGTNSTGCTEWERDFDPKTEQPRPEIGAGKIVAEFEGIFGNLTATERRWLMRRIAGLEV